MKSLLSLNGNMATAEAPDTADTRDAPDWVELTGDEDLVWMGHPSWYALSGSIGLTVVLVIAGIAILALVSLPLGWIGAGLVLVGVLVAVAGSVRRRSVTYVITDEEVYTKTGFLSRQVDNLRLDRIQNTGFDQSILERIFSYGDVRVETAGTGETEIVLRAVSNPGRVNAMLTERIAETTS